jgi:hypothetical protein
MSPNTTRAMISVDCDSSQKIIESSFARRKDGDCYPDEPVRRQNTPAF